MSCWTPPIGRRDVFIWTHIVQKLNYNFSKIHKATKCSCFQVIDVLKTVQEMTERNMLPGTTDSEKICLRLDMHLAHGDTNAALGLLKGKRCTPLTLNSYSASRDN